MSQDCFTLQTDVYHGPLDALLTLIEARKLSITDVSLTEVTDAYLAYVEKLPEMPLAETAQFVLVASTLLLIKSRALLPSVELTDEENYSIEELGRRLKRYAVYRKGARLLRSQWGKKPYTFPKRAPLRPILFNAGEAGLATLGSAAMRLLATLPRPEKLVEATVLPVLALEEVITRVRDRLAKAVRTRFHDLTKGADRHECIVYFLAMLELVRSGSISATQERIFSDIHLETEVTTGTPRYGI